MKSDTSLAHVEYAHLDTPRSVTTSKQPQQQIYFKISRILSLTVDNQPVKFICTYFCCENCKLCEATLYLNDTGGQYLMILIDVFLFLLRTSNALGIELFFFT